MKLKITIAGKVHDVGYRLFLLNQADSLLLQRFDARNVFINGREALIILVEGEKEQLDEFVEFLKKEKPEKAVVEEIKVEEYKGTIRTIDSYRNSLMLEQLNKIVQVGLNMLEKQDLMLEKQDLMLEKQDSMLKKQDETIKAIKEEGEKTRTYLARVIKEESEKTRNYLAGVIKEESEKTREYLGEKIDRISNKIDGLRLDLRSYLDERLKRIEEEIEAIKARIGMR